MDPVLIIGLVAVLVALLIVGFEISRLKAEVKWSKYEQLKLYSCDECGMLTFKHHLYRVDYHSSGMDGKEQGFYCYSHKKPYTSVETTRLGTRYYIDRVEVDVFGNVKQ